MQGTWRWWQSTWVKLSYQAWLLAVLPCCLKPRLQLRFDYDPTTTYRARLLSVRGEQKMNMSIFRRSRIVVLSQSNRTYIVFSITYVLVECVVVSSYRSRVVVESQLWYRLTIRLPSDYDVSRAPASIRREQKINKSVFRRIVVSYSRIVVESQL